MFRFETTAVLMERGMGLGGVSLFKLIIVLLILVLIFGTKRIKALAAGFGGAAKTFREAATDVPAPRQAKLDNAEPDAEFPERRRGDRA